MKISFAPMEGITIFCYRNVHHELFPDGVDRYYTPFLSIYKDHAIKKRDIREILPENNKYTLDLIVPQIMTNKASEIIWALGELKSRGFREINLNMGCPVATVVSKHKGSGMLEDPAMLDEIFREVFASDVVVDIEFSVKTRIGLRDPEEFRDILPVLNKYPFSNVIIHPRIRKQMYSGEPNMEIFKWAYDNSVNPVSYNGNIFTTDDYKRISEQFPDLKEIMIGRGLIGNPALAREIIGGEKLSQEEIRGFIEKMEEEYHNIIPGDIQVIHKMKELWAYMGKRFMPQDGKPVEDYIHKIMVSKSAADYRHAVRALYRACSV